jgi:VWFA-related protein
MRRGTRRSWGGWPGLVTSAAVLALVLLAAPRGQEPTFRTRTETVRIDVLVTEHGIPVKGLTAADFEVRDNNVPQRVELITHDPLPVSLVLVLDASESVQGARLANLVGASTALVDALDAKDQVALLAFNHALTLRSRQTANREETRRALAGIRGVGMTALRDAVHSGLLLGENGPGRGMMVVFSDGFDTSSWLTKEQVLATAQLADVLTYAVVIGPQQPNFLAEVTTATGGTVFHAESEAKLKATFLGVLEDFKNRYIIGYQPTGVDTKGWHNLRVRVKSRAVQVQARPGYVR